MRWLTAAICLMILTVAVIGQQYICGPNGCRYIYTPTVFQSPVVVAPAVKVVAPTKPEVKSMAYDGPLPTGVVPLAPILGGGEKYTYKGEVVDKKKIEDVLGSGKGDLIDDSKRSTVTVIGPDKERKETLAGIRAKLGAEFKYWEGPPADWSFEPGFVTAGNPVTIYCQAFDGKVLYRQDNGNVEAAVEAIRKANPAYDPKKDPDGKTPAAPNGNTLFLIAAAVVAFLMLRSTKQG